MSNSDAVKGQAAIQRSDYPAAINFLTKALKESQSPLWLTWRSIAYQRTGKYDLSLADADNALLAAISRGKRDLMATAHFRRAIAYHGLGRYGDSRLCLHWCNEYNEKEKGLTLWVAKVKSDFDKAGGDDAECNQKTAKKIPDKVVEVAQESANPKPDEKKVDLNGKGKEPVSATTIAPKPPTATPKEKVRQEWYQSTNTVTIEIFAKGIPKENAEVKIESGSLEVSFPVAVSDSTYDYTIDPFFSEVDASKSSFRITPHKIEIVLHKAKPGLKWSSLEGTEIISAPANTENASKIPDEVLNPALKKDVAPAYPTSSRTGPKNWDTVVSKEEVEDEEGVDDFFKKLYKDADPDTKRAMMKSYQESNGTSLSTSWSDVGSKTFETQPPEGMVAKKWGE